MLGAEVLAVAGNAVQGRDLERIAEPEEDVVAAHEERKRVLADLGDREREEPPGAVVGPDQRALRLEQVADPAHVEPAVQRLDLAVETSALLEQMPRCQFAQQRAGDREARPIAVAQQREGSGDRFGLAGRVVVHEERMRVATAVQQREQAAHEAAGPAEIAVRDVLDRRMCRHREVARVVDDGQRHVIAQIGPVEQRGDPSDRRADLRLPVEVRDDEPEAHVAHGLVRRHVVGRLEPSGRQRADADEQHSVAQAVPRIDRQIGRLARAQLHTAFAKPDGRLCEPMQSHRDDKAALSGQPQREAPNAAMALPRADCHPVVERVGADNAAGLEVQCGRRERSPRLLVVADVHLGVGVHLEVRQHQALQRVHRTPIGVFFEVQTTTCARTSDA